MAGGVRDASRMEASCSMGRSDNPARQPNFTKEVDMKLCDKTCSKCGGPEYLKTCKDREIRIGRVEKKHLLRALSLGIKYEKMDKKQCQKYAREVRKQARLKIDGKE